MSEFLPDPASTLEISADEVARWISLPQDQRPRLVDCREAEELAICQIEGNDWFPLGQFPENLEKIANGANHGVVVYCHHGMRSLRAANFLRARGVAQSFSLRGGIEAWADAVDPEMRRY